MSELEQIIDNQEDVPLVKINSSVSLQQIYCAKCYHLFDLPPIDKENVQSESESDTESEDSVSPIFREDIEDVEEQVLDEIATHMQSNPLVIWRSTFERDMIKEISTFLFEEWSEDDLCEDYDLPEIQDLVKRMTAYYFATESEMPPRQGGTPLILTPLRRITIANKLRVLANIHAPSQRTQEWYETRYGLLTASNAWKALGTEAQQNQLIVEKCIPFDKFKDDCARHGNLSPDNPMAWGQKYEPVTALIYESKNQTRLGEYGCIVHPDWEFLGASPDGINIDPESSVYGRMVEIKNIVNRDIDGIPLDAYWVQMQIQMEVADLDECDFVETRIKEYVSREEFLESANPYKGLVATFVPRITIDSIIKRQTQTESKPFYEYLLLNQSSVDEWVLSKKSENPDYVLSNINYWGLDQYSCVLVKRNRIWFNAAIPLMDKLWRTIEQERITGCDHRAPKKREPKASAQVVMVNKQEPHTTHDK